MALNPFKLTPKQVLAWFKRKDIQTSTSWRDFRGSEHNATFTISKIANLGLLTDIKAELEQALTDGMTAGEFAKEFKPIMEQRGWTGTASRLVNMFRTNMATAYSSQYYESTKKFGRGFYSYSIVDDSRVRPGHYAWRRVVLPVGSPWWDTHYPPNGWGCRCLVIWLKKSALKLVGRKGASPVPKAEFEDWTNPDTGKVEKVPKGIDPGWDYNPGINARQKSLNDSLKAKEAVA